MLLGRQRTGLLGMGPIAIKQMAQQQLAPMMAGGGGGRIIPATGRPAQSGGNIGAGLDSLGKALGQIGKQQKAEAAQAKAAQMVAQFTTPQSVQSAPGESVMLGQSPAQKAGMTEEQIQFLRGLPVGEAAKFIGQQVFKDPKENKAQSQAGQIMADVRAGFLTPKQGQDRFNKLNYTAPQKPTDTFRILTRQERETFGVPSDDNRPYQISELTGKVSVVGGGGVTVNTGDVPNTNPSAATETQTTAQTVGVPADIPDPFRSFTDPKKADEARKAAQASYLARKAKVEPELRQASGMIQSLERFMGLLKEQGTGGIFRNLPVVGAGGMLDAEKMVDPEAQEMQSIVDRMTPQMRQGMPGSASDRDVAMFRGATVSRKNEPGANENIARGLQAANQNRLAREAFLDDYFEAHGHTIGADRFWNEYLEANPIFEPEAPAGSYQLNENRQSRHEYFGGNIPEKKKVTRAHKNKTVAAFANAESMQKKADIFLGTKPDGPARAAIIASMDEEEKQALQKWFEENDYVD